MVGCIWLCKDTKFKAIHNAGRVQRLSRCVVYDYAKILNLKQFTTCNAFDIVRIHVVYDYAKILNLKQFTTLSDNNSVKVELYMTMQRY